MSATDILLIVLIIVVFVLASAKCIRDKKRGNSCCGDCTKCGGCGRK